eukprot:356923-Chlamydomonas_euryale.AAC.3
MTGTNNLDAWQLVPLRVCGRRIHWMALHGTTDAHRILTVQPLCARRPSRFATRSQLARWLVGGLAIWLAEWLVGELVGWLVGWLVVQMVGWAYCCWIRTMVKYSNSASRPTIGCGGLIGSYSTQQLLRLSIALLNLCHGKIAY